MQRTWIGLLLATSLVLGAAGVAAADKASGKIEKIDAQARTFVLQQGKESLTFSLEPSGRVLDGGKATSLDQLKAGELVEVVYTDQDGKHVASKVATHKSTTAAKHAKSATH